MKQIIILLISIAMCSTIAIAQKSKVSLAKSNLEFKDYPIAKKSIDAALVDESTINWPETYIVAAAVYIELFKKGKDTTGYQRAVEFFLKGLELDAKGDEKGKNIGKYNKDLKTAINDFINILSDDGYNLFSKGDYQKSIFYFESILLLRDNKAYNDKGVIDTANIYNCGLAGYNSSNYVVAEKYLTKVAEYKFGGADPIFLLNQVYTITEDSVKMEKNLVFGFNTYPEDSRILNELIKFYAASNKFNEAIEYVNSGIAKYPDVASYYYARGVLYEQTKQYDKAEIDYIKAIELKNDYFSALYNLGVLYYNEGVELHNTANQILDDKAFKVAQKTANASFEKSLPYLEKAKAVIDADADARLDEKIDIYNSLKNLYYRFDKIDKYEDIQKQISTLN